MRQKFGRHINLFIPALCDCMAEMEGVPVDDDCGEQVQPGNPIMLAALGGSVADFALATDTQRILQSVVGLALIEADLGTPLHVASRIHSIIKSVRSTRTLTQRNRQIVLAQPARDD